MTVVPSSPKVKTPPGLVWERGKGLTFETVGLDFGTSPFWTKRIPPLLGQKAASLYLHRSRGLRASKEVSTSDHAELTSESTLSMSQQTTLGFTADESEPESEGGSDAAEESE